jgi:Flp pilus assembly protein TadG
MLTSTTCGHRKERGSALVLIPALTLIVLLVAGLIIDSAIGFAAKRDLVEAVSAAANDAANGFNDESFFAEGGVALDHALVSRLGAESFRARSTGLVKARFESASITTVDGRPAVRVVATATAPRLFSVLVGDDSWELRAEVTSVTRDDDPDDPDDAD